MDSGLTAGGGALETEISPLAGELLCDTSYRTQQKDVSMFHRNSKSKAFINRNR